MGIVNIVYTLHRLAHFFWKIMDYMNNSFNIAGWTNQHKHVYSS